MPGKGLQSLARSILPRPVGRAIRQAAAAGRRLTLERKLPAAEDRFLVAYENYWSNGVVPAEAEQLLHLATWSSGGVLPGAAARSHGRPFDPDRFTAFPDELLRGIDPETAADAVESDGYYVAPARLPSDVLDDILYRLEAGPARPRGDGLGPVPNGRPGPDAPTWWMDPSEAIESTAVRRLLAERRLAEVGGRYLGVEPLIMSVVLWKSFAWRVADSNSAQQFHFDNDRAAFVKMFVYLTDVGLDNGPHTYVARSHREKPKQLLHGGRLTDEAVARHYPRSDWRVITGDRGTVFFADTQGFHKGGQVSSGERAMFQINLATDRFGITEPPIGSPQDALCELGPLVATAPRYFAELYREPTAPP